MARILVADDNAANRELMRAYLSSEGHELVEASSGAEALELAARALPDLALIDIMMPDLNGFETTVRLKKLAGERFLPVLLVSSLADPSSRVLGLRMGADDFLTKPIDRSELRVRVKNLLSLQTHERQLRQRHREMEELQRFRDEMSALLVHDLKNPVSIVLANLEFMLGSIHLDVEEREALDDARLAAYRTLRLLANLLDIAKSDAGRLVARRTPQPLRELMAPVAERYRRVAEPKGIRIEVAVPPGLEAAIDADLLTRVAENVLDNSLRYTPSGGHIRIDAVRTGERVQLSIGNSGAPIPHAMREKIFDKFAQGDTNLRRSNLGLGLYFCRLAAEAHGGSIRVEERAELPTVFVIELGA
jgi:two-component system sensor histidine kinase/response regulator